MMKQIKYLVLLALFLNANIHPLTLADWRVIATLLASTSIIGGTAGAVAGTQLPYLGREIGLEVGYRIGKKAGFISKGQKQGKAGGATTESKKSKIKRDISTTLPPLRQEEAIAGGIALGTSGSLLGYAMGKRLAIAYIARKYGVDTDTVLRAITYDLDLEKTTIQNNKK